MMIIFITTVNIALTSFDDIAFDKAFVSEMNLCATFLRAQSRIRTDIETGLLSTFIL